MATGGESAPPRMMRSGSSEAPAGGESASLGGNIKVCIRVRPFNRPELSDPSRMRLCVSMPSTMQVLVETAPEGEESDPKSFFFDRAYWSVDAADANFASQQLLMDELGVELRANILGGYNSCLFAYGQTGSGKTFSVLGSDSSPEMRGLLPRIVDAIFVQIEEEKADVNDFTCTVTYMEIYNEQIRDLLRPVGCECCQKLEVRRSPKLGSYVQGLTDTPVFESKDVHTLLEFGTKARTVGATVMNDQSSRSHCVFTVDLVRRRAGAQLRSRLNLVDLAGSERQKKTQATGTRLKEGSMINQSLTTLALVISKLSEAAGRRKGSALDNFVPFRNSKLTYVLQDSLCGNSKTVMIAAISPSSYNVEESIGTLKFAERVKKIKTSATKNEEKTESLVAELKRECEMLRARIANGTAEDAELKAAEALESKYDRDLKEQLKLAKDQAEVMESFLQGMGLSLGNFSHVPSMGQEVPQLVNISHDPSLQGCLVYFLRPRGAAEAGGDVRIGSASGNDICLSGLGIEQLMAVVSNPDDVSLELRPENGRVLLNGRRLIERQPLKNSDRLIFGYCSCFRVVVPKARAQLSEAQVEMEHLEQALAEVEPDESIELCQVYVRDMQRLIGAVKAEAFLGRFRRVNALVEEANAISGEVRPKDRFQFNVEVLMDLNEYQSEAPDCGVRLKKFDTGLTRLKNIVANNILKSGLRKQRWSELVGSKPVENFTTIGVFTYQAFHNRIEHLREVYEIFHTQGLEALDMSSPENDPWLELAPWEFAERAREWKMQQSPDQCWGAAFGVPRFLDVFEQERLLANRTVQAQRLQEAIRYLEMQQAILESQEEDDIDSPRGSVLSRASSAHRLTSSKRSDGGPDLKRSSARSPSAQSLTAAFSTASLARSGDEELEPGSASGPPPLLNLPASILSSSKSLSSRPGSPRREEGLISWSPPPFTKTAKQVFKKAAVIHAMEKRMSQAQAGKPAS